MRVQASIGHGTLGAGLDRQPARPPGLEAAYEVGRVREAEVLEGRGGEARLVPAVADEHDPRTEIAADPRVVVARGRIRAPLEHVARTVNGAGDAAVALAL